jgi:addiction module RelE/StbE family toxin
MRVKYDPDFLIKLKKLDVRIRKQLKTKIILFANTPTSPELNNHALKREWEGHRSIDITSNYRAIYKEIRLGKEVVAYFIAIGTHNQLYNS